MAEKEFEPEDPMELVGVEIPGGDPDQALDGIVQEYLLMGWTPLQILTLFRSPYFGVTHRIYQKKGEAYVKARIQRLTQEWQAGWLTSDAPKTPERGEAHG